MEYSQIKGPKILQDVTQLKQINKTNTMDVDAKSLLN